MSIHPNSLKNLKPLTHKQAVERGQKGGTAKSQNNEIRRRFAEIDAEQTTNEDIKEMLEVVKKKAKKGDLFAIRTYIEMVGMNNKATREEKEELDNTLLYVLEQLAKQLEPDLKAEQPQGAENEETEN